MITTQIITHGLIYGAVATGYLLLIMIVFSPRVWGYNDYPDIIKKKVRPQTSKEKMLAWVISLPWLVFVLGFPVYSTLTLRARLGGRISFTTAFINVLIMLTLATLGDLVLLDWLIVSRITPGFVVIPGTIKEDYKDFGHHYRGHAKAAILMIILAIIIAGLARLL